MIGVDSVINLIFNMRDFVMKFKLFAVATLVLSSLFVSQSYAVSYNGTWHMNKTNEGVVFTPLRAKSSNFCFLTKVQVEENSEDDDYSRCRVYRSSGSDWILEARTAGAADARCSAICYTN